MKIIILGQWGGYPEANSATSSFIVCTDDSHILVECGSGVLSKLQQYIPLSKLDAVIISHYHKDHMSDVGCLQYGLMIQNKLNNTNRILPIYGHNLDKSNFMSLTYESATQAVAIKAKHYVNIGPIKIEFLQTLHPVYTLAMKFTYQKNSFVYTSDTEWSDELVVFAQDSDVIISESSLYDEQLDKVRGHLTAGQAGSIAAKAKTRKLILTHLPHYGDHQKLLQQAKERFNKEILLAKEGLEIEITL